MNLSNDLKKQIDQHLGDVRGHLAAMPADEQRDIIQTLDTQIKNTLESRSNGQPTIELLNAIIAEMDSPESYGDGPSLFSPQNSRSLSPGLKIGFFILVGALALLFAFLWINDPFSSQWMEPETDQAIEQQK